MYERGKDLRIKKFIFAGLFLILLFGILTGVVCLQKVVASGFSEDENAEKFVKSGHMFKYNEKIYTVKNIHSDNFISISGNYVDTMLIYKDKIYWRKTTELGHFQCPLIQMNMDCTEQKTLTETVDSYAGMEVYDDYLYYISLADNENRSSRKINLSTMEESEAPPYILKAGDENVWFGVTLDEKETIYQAKPGFQDVQPVDSIKGVCLGVYNGILYYMTQEEDGTYTTSSYDPITQESEILVQGNQYKSICSGRGLYYKQVVDGTVTLYRKDLQTGAENTYRFGSFNVYMGGGLNELGEDVCITRFCPEKGEENTEIWKFSLINGNPEQIGSWYNPNAENAAKE